MQPTWSTLSDAEVIRLSLAQPEAFEVLFDRHFDAVYAFAYRRAPSNDPADIAGDTFRIAFESRSRYDLTFATALPWLYGIARNLVRRRVARDQRRGRAHERAATRAPDTSDPGTLVATSLDTARDLETVLRLLRSESPEAVEALRLHVWEGLSYEDIARALALPIGTVRSRINRLRVRLRAELTASDRGATPTRSRRR